MKTKSCKMCETIKPVSEFHSAGYHTRQDGTKVKNFKPDCKMCANDKLKKQYLSRVNEAVDKVGKKYECERCGYNKCTDALEFHHPDPSDKKFAIGEAYTASLTKLTKEIAKCQILCCRCHREYHAGIWK